tara:strand:- start:795 stop:1592 length:798 start_codon:yes stop_codon:yes gene_type:complete
MKLVIDDNKKYEQFGNIFQNAASINDQFNIHLDANGLFMQGFDKASICVLETRLNAGWFTEYSYNNPTKSIIGMNIKTFYKILNTKQPGQKMIMEYEFETDHLKIIFTGDSNKECKKGFKMALLDIDCATMEIPDDEQDVEFIIEQAIFSTNVDQLLMFDDNVNIKVDNDNIYMQTNGMEGDMDVTINTDNLEEFSSDECENGEFLLNQNYALKYIKYMCNFSKVSKLLTIKISNERPFCCVYKIDEEDSNSYLRFYLAPKDSSD